MSRKLFTKCTDTHQYNESMILHYCDCPDRLNIRVYFVESSKRNNKSKVINFSPMYIASFVIHNTTAYIQPICLPGSTRLKSKTFDDESMDVAGWGMTENGKNHFTLILSLVFDWNLAGTYSDFKLKVRVPGVPLSECVETYKNTYRTTIGPNQLCAGGVGGKDSCKRDSGGSLLFIDESHPTYSYSYCVGVVSFGPKKCGQNGIPGIYTRVASYIDWIVENIREWNELLRSIVISTCLNKVNYSLRLIFSI